MALLRSCIWRDVSIFIGPLCEPVGQGVLLEQFKKWLEVTFEICGYSYPESVIETNDGSLIMDPRYRGKVFLKGLLLPACALETRSF